VATEAISHSREEETPEAKARWFQSLALAERMELLCAYYELFLAVNPRLIEQKNAQPIKGRVAVDLEDVRLLRLSEF